ncbi:unnamed protein product [Angiostrongylus costaricensis]|uniref:7TM_GPCR_Srx domain-containing protein n=1 Tax=Angiostrongylus costaricensis TaxID=334426 RepID=A0A158PM42_ANGCS|nr:unnamed protein product [Angiostrongylus costaricensis]
MHEFVAFNGMNIILGLISFMVNILLLSVLLGSPVLRRKTEVLLRIPMESLPDDLHRAQYTPSDFSSYVVLKVIDTLSIPVRTCWQCATEPWVVFRVYGKRLIILKLYSQKYAKRINKRRSMFISAKFWCGRKASFGDFYASFIYFMDIFGYIFSFILTTTSYFKIALIDQYVGTVAAFIAKPTIYLTCINSMLGIFVCLALYGEFRVEFIKVLRMVFFRHR